MVKTVLVVIVEKIEIIQGVVAEKTEIRVIVKIKISVVKVEKIGIIVVVKIRIILVGIKKD